MNQPTIRVSPSDLPKFNFLQYRNYLGEFKTEIDKARVRYNLGIPDSLSFKWGNIGGTIENQTDLMQLVRQSVNNQYTVLSQTVDGLVNKANTLTDNILTINNDRNSIQLANENYKQELEQRLLELEREVSQNATLIKLIGGDGVVVDLSSITSQITALKNRVTALENNPVDLSNITSAITQLQNDRTSMQSTISTLSDQNITLQTTITSLQTTIQGLQTDIQRLQAQIGINSIESISVSRNNIEATTASDKATIIVTATFTNGSTREVTSECTVESSNTNVATWNNGIIFVGAGSATITYTFSYNGVTRTATTLVTVTSTQQDIPTQFVGYAQNYSQVIDNNNFACNTVYGTWTESNTPYTGAAPYRFFIITTQTINSVLEAGLFPWDLASQEPLTISGNGGILYRVYQGEPVRERDVSITIN